MLLAAYDLGITILRFPDGSWGDQAQAHTESVGVVELSGSIPVPSQSITLYIVQ